MHSTSMKGITCLAIDGNDRFVATGGMDTVVNIFDLEKQKIVSSFSGHNQTIKHLTILNGNDQQQLRCCSISKD